MATDEEMKNTSNELSEQEMQDVAGGRSRTIGLSYTEGRPRVRTDQKCLYFQNPYEPVDTPACGYCKYFTKIKGIKVCDCPENRWHAVMYGRIL